MKETEKKTMIFPLPQLKSSLLDEACSVVTLPFHHCFFPSIFCMLASPHSLHTQFNIQFVSYDSVKRIASHVRYALIKLPSNDESVFACTCDGL